MGPKQRRFVLEWNTPVHMPHVWNINAFYAGVQRGHPHALCMSLHQHMSLLQLPSDCCCTLHMWNSANMTSPHDSIKLKEVWGDPECNYYSTTQESLHERAKRCRSRTLWAPVFNTNSIVSYCEFWFYFGTSEKSFRMAREIWPSGKSSHLWTWRFEPESVRRTIWTGHVFTDVTWNPAVL